MNTHIRPNRSSHLRAEAHNAPTHTIPDLGHTASLDDIWNLLTDELTSNPSATRRQPLMKDVNLWSAILAGDHDDI